MGEAERDAVLRDLAAPLPVQGSRLAGKVALVSGAGCGGGLLGIGSASAILFAAQGAAVGLLDIDAGRAEQTAAYINALGGRSLVVPCDIRERQECERAVSRVLEANGHLDILMNSTAATHRGTVESISPEDWRACIEVNLTGTLQLTAASAPALRLSGAGSVINVSSIAATRSYGLAIGYAATKAGVEAMTREMACSLGASAVRVNCLVPGMLVTPMGGSRSSDAVERRRGRTVLEFDGTAWDAAWPALFLASEESRWMTGTTLVVDAGTSILPGAHR
jgi:NAD(P)-dependent dehydrogenase (short-subunit alcohol dehydrogenase family)